MAILYIVYCCCYFPRCLSLSLALIVIDSIQFWLVSHVKKGPLVLLQTDNHGYSKGPRRECGPGHAPHSGARPPLCRPPAVASSCNRRLFSVVGEKNETRCGRVLSPNGDNSLCGFYKEPSPTGEPFFRLRHLYRFFKEPWFERFFVEPEMVP